MKYKKNLIIVGVVVLVVMLIVGGYFELRSPWKYRGDGPIKIFHLNSYNYGFPLVDDDIAAFRNVFENRGVEVEMMYFEMDGLRDSSVENLERSAREAVLAIEEFGPDLIYATDDPAQKYVIVPYYRDSDIPVVFAAVNADVKEYDYDEADNVAGIYERLLFVEAMDLLKQLYPYATRAVLMTDNFPQWVDVVGRFKDLEGELQDIEFVGWETYDTFEEYKKGVLEYEDRVDVFVFLGLNALAGEDGVSVPRSEVVRWNVENIDLPDVSFWNFLVEEGTLLAEEISSSDQGSVAGKMAYDILVEGVSPNSFSFMKIVKGTQYINLARAEKLDLNVHSIVLINSEVVESFPWEEEV